MTPEEKAEELIGKSLEIYDDIYYFPPNIASKHAIMCVDEIMAVLNDGSITMHMFECFDPKCSCLNYWKEVKRILTEEY